MSASAASGSPTIWPTSSKRQPQRPQAPTAWGFAMLCLMGQPYRAPREYCPATGKVRHETAIMAFNVLGRLDHSRGFRSETRAYECELCGGWHLTKMSLDEYEQGEKKRGNRHNSRVP